MPGAITARLPKILSAIIMVIMVLLQNQLWSWKQCQGQLQSCSQRYQQPSSWSFWSQLKQHQYEKKQHQYEMKEFNDEVKEDVGTLNERLQWESKGTCWHIIWWESLILQTKEDGPEEDVFESTEDGKVPIVHDNKLDMEDPETPDFAPLLKAYVILPHKGGAGDMMATVVSHMEPEE